VLGGFPVCVITCGAENSARASVNELKIVVEVLPECQLLRPVLKKNDLKPHNCLILLGENDVSHSRVFVYSVRGEPAIVQASFVNKECSASLCCNLFFSHISLDQIWNEVMTLTLKRFGSKCIFVFPCAILKYVD
jgi:hypothetical protein